MSSESESDSSDVDDEQSSNKRVINVVIIGESGVGKSALINLIHDADVVLSSDQAIGCTTVSAKIVGEVKDHPDLRLHLYDTAGLSESADGSIPTSEAFVQLIKLCYAIPGGIHLLIFCHAKGRLSSAQFKTNYRVFFEDLCEKSVPALLVVTNCDTDDPLNYWWDTNKDLIRNKLRFEFVDGVCVSTVRSRRNSPDQILEVYKTSRCNIIEAIERHASRTPISIDSWKRKLIVYIRQVFNTIADWLQWFGLQQRSLRPELEQMFTELQFSPQAAKVETEKLLRELQNPDLIGPYQVVSTDSC